jgi:hypothetical protein
MLAAAGWCSTGGGVLSGRQEVGGWVPRGGGGGDVGWVQG